MLIDTHAHIDMEDFGADFEQMRARAQENGVQKIIIPAVEPSTFERVLKTAEKSPNLYAAIGVHPEDAKNFDENALNLMEKMIKHPKVVAVGKIGLDYYWDRSYNDVQKAVFEAQIEFAKKHDKPIIVHDREAHGDSLEILKRTNAAEVGVVMHCFSGSPEFALECVKEGFYIALGGVVTFKNAKKMKEVAKIVPLERLLLETDSPYLTPVPFRGKRNEPAYVKYAAEEIANLRGIGFEELARATTENAIKIFRLNEVQNG